MNECDADRVLQVRQAVREQAHCELPAVEKLGDALSRYMTETTPVPHWAGLVWCLAFLLGMLGKWIHGKKSRRSQG